MAHGGRGNQYEEPGEEEDEKEEEEMAGEHEGKGSGRKRRRSNFIDDAAMEDDEEDEYDDGDDGRRGRKQWRRAGSEFFELEAAVDSDEDEEDEEERQDDFINDGGAELPDDDDGRRLPHSPTQLEDEEEEDIDELNRQLRERYARSRHIEYGEEAKDAEQQALLPSVKDPKLWMVKCTIGHEREAAICLMQKSIDKDLQIKSAVALDHLENYIYVEADKEAHVKEACKGLCSIYSGKMMLIPIKEMTDVLSVVSKTIDLSRDTWVRMKTGIYKGDLAKVVDIDNIRHRVTIKLIPRIDLRSLANKLEGKVVVKKKAFVPPPRFFSINEARKMHIQVECTRDKDSGEYFESVGGMKFKDGFLYKSVSMNSFSSQNMQLTFDELEKFQRPGDGTNGDMAISANRKKGHFMEGDAVIVIRGDLKNLMGSVEKVEDENVHIRPKGGGLPKTISFHEKELCKYFKPGDHVKVVSGVQEGATGMVVKVEGHVLTILSDMANEDIRVFADNVVESSKVTSGVSRIGHYELHDLVLLDNMSFGVVIHVESEAFQVLKGVPDRPEVVLVKLREIRNKIERRAVAQDHFKNTVSMKDVVRVLEGPYKGRHGPVEYIYKGILFLYDRHHLKHADFICVKSQSCVVVGGSHGSRNRNDDHFNSRFCGLRSSSHILQSPGRVPREQPPIDSWERHRGARGHDSLVGRTIKICLGPFKGYRGRVTGVTGTLVRVELDSQMKIVTVQRGHISDTVGVATPYSGTPRHGLGSETPMRPSQTPLHPYMTPMRDPGATPIHYGMRTPIA